MRHGTWRTMYDFPIRDQDVLRAAADMLENGQGGDGPLHVSEALRRMVPELRGIADGLDRARYGCVMDPETP